MMSPFFVFTLPQFNAIINNPHPIFVRSYRSVVDNPQPRITIMPGNYSIPGVIDPTLERYDFSLGSIQAREATECRAGEVLQGRLKPTGCSAFGTLCTPESPLGAPMVSSEGACAAYYRSGRRPDREVHP